MTTDEIKELLIKDLKPSRYKHTIGVAYTAMALAMRYELPLRHTEAAGLLHDCAKCMSDDDLLKYCIDNYIELSEAELNNHALIHSKVGAVLARQKYNIENEDILDAIRFHTTGRPGMTMLEKIIFTADYIEPGRYLASRLDEIRKMAFIDIDACIYMISSDTLHYLEITGCVIDNMTKQTCEFYKEYYENWRKANE
ncbi:MAG: bis(5'-nucleosyl)-tetraphosphatase (symmetrical) YqeK [Lachnospiraceae bacterium]|nr:bis(5'-nucleosyl)-tetraphosphatase (symmetrical) YqeK [Lachnospiraceae bacterium]